MRAATWFMIALLSLTIVGSPTTSPPARPAALYREQVGVDTYVEIAAPPPVVSSATPRIASSPFEDESRFGAEEVLRGFEQAYPDRVDRVEKRGDDWAIRIDDRWFVWCGGRLLPEGECESGQHYAPHVFYDYPHELPTVQLLSPAGERALANLLAQRRSDPPTRHSGIYRAIWRIENEDDGYARAKTTYFLGQDLMIHRELLEDLAAVEEEVLEAAEFDAELRGFIRRIGSVTGYNWRLIAGTNTLSYHSLGIAIDIMPYDLAGQHVYWRWSRGEEPHWYAIPHEERFNLPAALVQAFENHGFVWGGKWFFFDTMHFEYRPEILRLNGFIPNSPIQ